MGANLFKTGCKSCIGPIAQDELECLGVNYTPSDCTAENVAQCGQNFSDLLKLYPVFNLDLPFNLNDRLFEFMDRAIFIEDNGYSVTLRQANTEIFNFVQAMSIVEWTIICKIKLDKKYNPDTLYNLTKKYELYRPSFYTQRWSEFSRPWSEASVPWKKTSYKKDFIYRRGDSFITLGSCQETMCLYLVVKDLESTANNIGKYSSFQSNSEYWVKIFCIETGFNSCLGHVREKHPTDLYEVINIGDDCHKVERPLIYTPAQPLLNNIS